MLPESLRVRPTTTATDQRVKRAGLIFLSVNRVDEWGEEWPHDWQTWRAMLPKYVEELVAA